MRLGWFTSHHDPRCQSAFVACLSAIAEQRLDIDIAFVLIARSGWSASTRDLADCAGRHGIPVVGVDPAPYRRALGTEWRNGFEEAVIEAITPHSAPEPQGPERRVDLLLGYGYLAGPRLLGQRRMVNIHPALPDGPTGTERSVISELIASDATHSGLIAHVVTEELDRGPVICQASFPRSDFSATWPRRAVARTELLGMTGRLLPSFTVATLQALGRLDPGTWPPTPPTS